MTDFLTADTNLPSYMMFPRFLLDMEINETAKMLYMILLDRARLSQKNEGWSDTNGHVFLYFTIEALAEVLHKSQMTYKMAGLCLLSESPSCVHLQSQWFILQENPSLYHDPAVLFQELERAS